MTTYYVDAVDGNDANLGTSEGSGNAWQTITHAATNVVAGDVVYIKASGNYNEQVTPTVPGTASAAIHFIGYTTTPGDNGKCTIDGQSTRSYCIQVTTTVSHYHVWRNIICQNTTGQSVYYGNGDRAVFHNCEFLNSSSAGIFGDNNFGVWHCIFDGHPVYAVDIDNNGIFVGNTCINMSGNTALLNITGTAAVYKNLLIGPNADHAVYNTSGNAMQAVGNTIVGPGQDAGNNAAFFVSTSWPVLIADNIIKDYDYFMEGTGSQASFTWGAYYGYNLLDNVTADWNLTGTLVIDILLNATDFVDGNANFTDEAGGDYTLGATSDAIDAGITPVNEVDV